MIEIAEVFAKLRHGATSEWSLSLRPEECALVLRALDDEFVESLASLPSPLPAQTAEMREALEPFARVGREITEDFIDEILIAWRTGKPSITVSPDDFRRAARALAAAKEPSEPSEREVDGTPSDAVCECGHPARLHWMGSPQPACRATVYTDAPVGGGSAFPCHCRRFAAAVGPQPGEAAKP